MSPDVSVVLPTRDRPGDLAVALGSLAAQTLEPARFEVVVVDDAGTMDLGPVVDGVRDGLPIRCIRGEGRGPGPARNLGAAQARAPLLAFVDDDCTASPGWLDALLAAHRERPSAMLGGQISNALPHSATARASQVILDQSYARYTARPDRGRFFAAMNLAVPANGFDELGGFDESFRWSEDRELCDRWRAQGRPMRFVPDAEVHHGRRMSLGGFIRQHFGYGRGAYLYHRSRTARAGFFRPDIGFYLRFLPLPAVTRPLWHALTLVPLLGIWHMANTAGFLYEMLQRRTP